VLIDIHISKEKQNKRHARTNIQGYETVSSFFGILFKSDQQHSLASHQFVWHNIVQYLVKYEYHHS